MWLDEFGGVPATDGGISQVIPTDSGDLILVGSFSEIAGMSAPALARWDGTRATGEWGIIAGSITSLYPYQDGFIAVGGFSTIDVGVRVIGFWDGTSWTDWSGVFQGDSCDISINSVVVQGDDAYVGGHFLGADNNRSPSIAKWNGESWEQMGPGLPGLGIFDCFFASVSAIGITTSGTLLASGSFGRVEGPNEGKLFEWDGSEWQLIAGNIDGYVDQIIPDDHGGTFLGGHFTHIGDIPTKGAAYWYKGSIHALDAGLTEEAGELFRMPDGELLMAQQYPALPDGSARIMSWHGFEWREIVQRVDGYIQDIVETTDGDRLISGRFSSRGPDYAVNLAKWNGITWEPMIGDSNRGADAGVTALIPNPTDGSMKVVGGFTHLNRIRFDGQAYRVNGMWKEYEDTAENEGLISIGPDGTRLIRENELISNGQYQVTLTRSRNGEMEDLDPVFGYVRDAISCPDDYIYFSGRFSFETNSEPFGLATWDGSRIIPLARSSEVDLVGLECHPDNGVFVNDVTNPLGDELKGIALWQDGSWKPLGNTAPEFAARDMEIDLNGDLIVSGRLDMDPTDKHRFTGLIRWDGLMWHPVSPMEDESGAGQIEIDRWNRYYTASYRYVNEQSIRRRISKVRMFDGSEWHDLGSEISGTINAMELVGDQLFIGGGFTYIGSMRANNLGIWQIAEPTAIPREASIPGSDPELAIFPMPAFIGSPITIQYSLSNPGSFELEIFDLLGRKITTIRQEAFSGAPRSFQWSPAGLAAGMYIMRMKKDGKPIASRPFQLIR